MKGVVFCGGRGVRLRPLTYYFQKVMIPVGSDQRPLLECVIRLLKYHKVYDIVLMVNYKASQIVNYFGEGSRFGVDIGYVYDRPGMGGTGGALLNAFSSGVIGGGETLLIYYGDILSNIDLSELLGQHADTGAVASVALSTNFPLRVGVAEVIEDGRILRFVEKPKLEKPVSIGVLSLDGERALKYLKRLAKSREELDIMADLIPHMIGAGEPVHAYMTRAFWYDVGTTERYEKLDNAFVDEKLKYLFE